MLITHAVVYPNMIPENGVSRSTYVQGSKFDSNCENYKQHTANNILVVCCSPQIYRILICSRLSV